MKYSAYLGLLLIAISSACTSPEKNEQATPPANEFEVGLTPAQAKNINLQVGLPETGEISQTLKLQGRIDVPPQNLVSVSIPLGGYLKSTHLLPGTRVKKGQVIAVMEDPQYIQLQQDYLSIRNKLNYATAELRRQQALNQSKASSDKTLQQTETEFQNLKIEHQALAEKLKLINVSASQLNSGKISRSVNVYAPIDGFVSKVNVNIGKYVTPSEVLFELINPTDIHLNLTVFERDLDHLRIGQRVVAYTNAQPQKKYDTEVILVSHQITDGKSEVHCHFEKYDAALVPGMYMNAELQLRQQQQRLLPEDAVVNFEDQDYVFIQTAALKFRMTPVSTGETAGGRTAVQTDLGPQKVVTRGAYSLLMKLKNTSDEE